MDLFTYHLFYLIIIIFSCYNHNNLKKMSMFHLRTIFKSIYFKAKTRLHMRNNFNILILIYKSEYD